MPQPDRSEFKDHFSQTAAAYAAHRPVYPVALVDFLAGLATRRELAWDAGCGSGQLSLLLADRFERVIATDASPEQLARARPHARIEYRRAPAEECGLPNAAVDLAAAAQAAHWFDLTRYYAEVRRVARPAAVVAMVSYDRIRAGGAADRVIDRFYTGVLGEYWPPERRYVDDRYRSLPFPFDEIAVPELELRAEWTLADVLGYVGTWSAVWALERAVGRAPLAAFERELARAWGPAAAVRSVRWDLALRVGRV